MVYPERRCRNEMLCTHLLRLRHQWSFSPPALWIHYVSALGPPWLNRPTISLSAGVSTEVPHVACQHFQPTLLACRILPGNDPAACKHTLIPPLSQTTVEIFTRGRWPHRGLIKHRASLNLVLRPGFILAIHGCLCVIMGWGITRSLPRMNSFFCHIKNSSLHFFLN